ncbi:unnamed protein product, partial [marine sediment metagenome]
TGIGTATFTADGDIYYAINLPGLMFGTAIKWRAATVFFTLAGTAQIDSNTWREHVPSGATTIFDDDSVAITAGKTHSASNLPRTVSPDSVLYLNLDISGTGVKSAVTIRGVLVTYDIA